MLDYPMPSVMTNGFSYIGVPGMQACWNPNACKFKVEGTGSIKVKPDVAVVSLGS